MEWELYISGNCNTYQTWKTATFATGAVAILFLAAMLSLAVYILLKKQNTKSLRGQETTAEAHLEMQNNFGMVDLRRPNAIYRETEDIYENPDVLWDIGESTSNIPRSNRALETNQQSSIGYSGMYEIPRSIQKGTKVVYEDVTDRRLNSDNMYVNLPGIRS